MDFPFDPQALRRQLPDWPASAMKGDDAHAYRDYYQLQFPAATQVYQGALESAGYRIACLKLVPVKPHATLVLVHGYFDHLALYRHLFDYYLSRGVEVITFDLPGHGLSSGPRGYIEDFSDYQAVLESVLSHCVTGELPLWLMGQSTGGAVVAEYLSRSEGCCPKLAGSVLLAPLVRPANWPQVKRLYWWLGWLPGLPRRFPANGEDTFMRFIRDRDPLIGRLINSHWIGALKRWVEDFELRAPSCAAPLIVQGDADETLDWEHNLEVLAEKFPASRLLRLSGARHQLANECLPVRQTYLDWLAAQGVP